MLLPFIMEQAEALKDAIPAFKKGQPIGDGIGPLVVGGMMLDTKKQNAEFETVYSELLQDTFIPQGVLKRETEVILPHVGKILLPCFSFSGIRHKFVKN